MNRKQLSVMVCCIAVGLAATALAESSIWGRIGSETPIWVNACGDDQGNGNAVSANVTGEYHIGHLPGDRYYMHSHFGKFYLPDGADLEVNAAPPFPDAYSNSYSNDGQEMTFHIGQQFLANGRYFKAVSAYHKFAEAKPMLNASVRIQDPYGDEIVNLGAQLMGNELGWRTWSVPYGTVPTIPGKKYFMQFDVVNGIYFITDFHNNNYLDGDEWNNVQVWEDLPAKDMSGAARCYADGQTVDFSDGTPNGYYWTGEIWQVFTAQGVCLNEASFFLPWDANQMLGDVSMFFSIHEYGGPTNPLGPQIGPKKRSAPTWKYSGGNTAMWCPCEVQMVPGQKYVLKIVRATGGGFVAWAHKDNPQPLGDLYVDQELQVDANLQGNANLQGSISSDAEPYLPLSISNVNASLTPTTATVTWQTSLDAMSQVEYWTNDTDHQHTTLDETQVSSHSVRLTCLKGNTVYNYRVKSFKQDPPPSTAKYEYAQQPGTFTTACDSTLAGTVTDQGGVPIPGASVALVPGGCGWLAATSADGSYTIRHIEPGTYGVEVSMPGYSTVTVPNVVLPPDCSTVNLPATRLTQQGEFVANGGFEIPDPVTGSHLWTWSVGNPPKDKNHNWFGPPGATTGCQFGTGLCPDSGSWMAGRIANYTWCNGWLWQKIATSPGRTITLSAWNALYYADDTGLAPDCYQKIGLDPNGGSNPDSPDIIWSPEFRWTTSGVASPWTPLTVTARTRSNINGNKMTVWLRYYQMGGPWRANFFDDVRVDGRPGADFDGDGDVDVSDFAIFRDCASGPMIPQLRPECQKSDLDEDSDVDVDDFGRFQPCYGGMRPESGCEY